MHTVSFKLIVASLLSLAVFSAAQVACDDNCIRRLTYEVAYSSGAAGVGQVMTAYDSRDWCASADNSIWCPEMIEGYVSGMAGKLTNEAMVTSGECDTDCAAQRLANVSREAAVDSMVWAMQTVNGSSNNPDLVAIRRLKWTVWHLQQKTNPTQSSGQDETTPSTIAGHGPTTQWVNSTTFVNITSPGNVTNVTATAFVQLPSPTAHANLHSSDQGGEHGSDQGNDSGKDQGNDHSNDQSIGDGNDHDDHTKAIILGTTIPAAVLGPFIIAGLACKDSFLCGGQTKSWITNLFHKIKTDAVVPKIAADTVPEVAEETTDWLPYLLNIADDEEEDEALGEELSFADWANRPNNGGVPAEAQEALHDINGARAPAPEVRPPGPQGPRQLYRQEVYDTETSGMKQYMLEEAPDMANDWYWKAPADKTRVMNELGYKPFRILLRDGQHLQSTVWENADKIIWQDPEVLSPIRLGTDVADAWRMIDNGEHMMLMHGAEPAIDSLGAPIIAAEGAAGTAPELLTLEPFGIVNALPAIGEAGPSNVDISAKLQYQMKDAEGQRVLGFDDSASIISFNEGDPPNVFIDTEDALSDVESFCSDGSTTTIKGGCDADSESSDDEEPEWDNGIDPEWDNDPEPDSDDDVWEPESPPPTDDNHEPGSNDDDIGKQEPPPPPHDDQESESDDDDDPYGHHGPDEEWDEWDSDHSSEDDVWEPESPPPTNVDAPPSPTTPVQQATQLDRTSFMTVFTPQASVETLPPAPEPTPTPDPPKSDDHDDDDHDVDLPDVPGVIIPHPGLPDIPIPDVPIPIPLSGGDDDDNDEEKAEEEKEEKEAAKQEAKEEKEAKEKAEKEAKEEKEKAEKEEREREKEEKEAEEKAKKEAEEAKKKQEKEEKEAEEKQEKEEKKAKEEAEKKEKEAKEKEEKKQKEEEEKEAKEKKKEEEKQKKEEEKEAKKKAKEEKEAKEKEEKARKEAPKLSHPGCPAKEDCKYQICNKHGKDCETHTDDECKEQREDCKKHIKQDKKRDDDDDCAKAEDCRRTECEGHKCRVKKDKKCEKERKKCEKKRHHDEHWWD